MKTEQPLWGRGQMVSPQHFQQQAAYAAWSAECIARLGLSHPWGVINATFEPDVLKLGRLQARHLHLRFPDRGFMRDGEGREIDFRNTVILMTSNLGSDLIMQLLDEQPEATEPDLHELLRPVLRDHFQPALLARFQTVIYRPLAKAAMRTIIGMKLGQTCLRRAWLSRRCTAMRSVMRTLASGLTVSRRARIQQLIASYALLKHQKE